MTHKDSKTVRTEVCEHCGSVIHTRRRKLSKEMLRFLRELGKRTEPDGDYIHTRDLFPAQTKASTDGSYMTKWNLIERRDGEAGWYRITRYGFRFLRNERKASRWVDVRMNEAVGWGPQVFLRELV